MLSVHTSPLHQPGTGDAGGMNVYIVELAKRLAAINIEVEIFTRATTGALPPAVELAPGVLVRHVDAGPYEGLAKEELPAQLCAFTHGVMQAWAGHRPGYYDLVHSHYWLSGHVGWLAAERWGVPLVHAMHTMAKVKNAALADGDTPEPAARVIGETQIVARRRPADRQHRRGGRRARPALRGRARQGRRRPPRRQPRPLPPRPTAAAAARARLGLPQDALIPLFAGRIQPLKAPDVLLRAVAVLLDERPVAARRGWSSPWSAAPAAAAWPSRRGCRSSPPGSASPTSYGSSPPVGQEQLADWYRAASVLVMPSYSESFGLVAIEAQACGTPVVAAAVGGLPVAVRDGAAGFLVPGHDPADYARVLGRFVDRPGARRPAWARRPPRHAQAFGWDTAAAATADVYTAAHARAPPSPTIAPWLTTRRATARWQHHGRGDRDGTASIERTSSSRRRAGVGEPRARHATSSSSPAPASCPPPAR